MKKLITAIVAIMIAATLAFGMTACGASPEEKLKNFVESDTFQSQVDAQKASLGSTLDLDVKVEGSNLIYECIYKTQISEDLVEDVKTRLDTAFNSMSSTYESIANELKSDLKLENPVVIVRILNADNTTITEYKFEATE